MGWLDRLRVPFRSGGRTAERVDALSPPPTAPADWPQELWHENASGMPTRNAPPRLLASRPELELRPAQLLARTLDAAALRTFNAFHEAGHIRAAYEYGIPVLEARLASVAAPDRRGRLAGFVHTGAADVSLFGAFVQLAAGERAGNAWLREAGKYNAETAWAAEMGGHHDRRQAMAIGRANNVLVNFGGPVGVAEGELDYALACMEADKVLQRDWSLIHDIATELASEGRLSSQRISALMAPSVRNRSAHKAAPPPAESRAELNEAAQAGETHASSGAAQPTGGERKSLAKSHDRLAAMADRVSIGATVSLPKAAYRGLPPLRATISQDQRHKPAVNTGTPAPETIHYVAARVDKGGGVTAAAGRIRGAHNDVGRFGG